MKPGTRETIPTISEIVREATAICDPEGTDTAVLGFFESFEDDDRPATAAEDLQGELLSTVRGIDPSGSPPTPARPTTATTSSARAPASSSKAAHPSRSPTGYPREESSLSQRPEGVGPSMGVHAAERQCSARRVAAGAARRRALQPQPQPVLLPQLEQV
jgi:hypothetical protein